MKDLYKILGVEKDASREDIKKAYHKIAKEKHPDKNKGKEDGAFTDAALAYYILSDEEKRNQYDCGIMPAGQDNNAKAINMIVGLFIHAIESNTDHKTNNLVRIVEENISRNKSSIDYCIIDCEESLKKYNDIKKRILKGDFLLNGIEVKINEIEKNIFILKQEYDAINIALKHLENCSYEHEEESKDYTYTCTLTFE